MILFKHKDNDNIFGIDNLTDDTLVGMYNICLNYKSYLQQLMRLPDSELLKLAPGTGGNLVRHNLEIQMKTCDDYIKMWNETISAGGTKQLQN